MKEFSFCESSLASSMSPWHIRVLTEVGLRPSGGVDTTSLCGRVKPYSIVGGFGGWDLHVRPAPDLGPWLKRGSVCIACAELYKKEQAMDKAPTSWSTPEVLQILRNVGVNVECGSCAEIAFTGATTNAHTCKEVQT